MLVSAFGRLQVTRYKQDGGGTCRTCSRRWYQWTTATTTTWPPRERVGQRSPCAAPLTGARGWSATVKRQWDTCWVVFVKNNISYGNLDSSVVLNLNLNRLTPLIYNFFRPNENCLAME